MTTIGPLISRHVAGCADRILVVDGGVIAEAGSPEELLRKGGRYASFYRLQLQSQAPSRGPAAAAAM